tara:strand:+ start:413 stop:523 length:111 start_codon:yes stop_codon:yes gene_type:complete
MENNSLFLDPELASAVREGSTGLGGSHSADWGAKRA